MNSDFVFRWAPLAALLFAMVWGGYHRLRAERAGGPVSRAAEGRALFAALRLSGLVMWGVVFAYFINPRSVAFSAAGVPDSARWAGMGMLVVGVVWLSWMFRTLGLNVTDTVLAREAGTLVTSGPYRWVRHPMYVGVAPLMLGMALVIDNWLAAVFGALAFILLVVRTRIEERYLIARYGDAYREYMRRTGAFFPRGKRQFP